MDLPTVRDLSAKRIVELDGIRAIAIIGVMFVHYGNYCESHNIFERIGLRLCGLGWIGVDMFFVLSGFLITSILMTTKNRDGYFTNFYARRTLRIFPLYYGTLVLVFVVMPLIGMITREDPLYQKQLWYWLYLSNFLSVQHPAAGEVSSVPVQIAHFWTLAIEEQFYLFWPLVVKICSVKRLMQAGVAMLIVGMFARLCVGLAGGRPGFNYLLTPLRIDSLAIGGSLAAMIHLPNFNRRFAAHYSKIALAASLAIISLITVWRQGFRTFDLPVQVAGYPALAVGTASFILLLISADRPVLGARLLRSRALVFIGKLSYGLYVFHYLVIGIVARAVPVKRLETITGSTGLAIIAFFAVQASVAIVIAISSWQLIESPILSLKRFFEFPPAGPKRLHA